MQFNRIGIENTVEMNKPLLSKYCSRENDRQFLAANSFIVSEKYTSNTKMKNKEEEEETENAMNQNWLQYRWP